MTPLQQAELWISEHGKVTAYIIACEIVKIRSVPVQHWIDVLNETEKAEIEDKFQEDNGTWN